MGEQEEDIEDIRYYLLGEEEKETTPARNVIVGYARVSATKQEREPGRQEEWYLKQVFTDVASGIGSTYHFNHSCKIRKQF